MKHRITVCLTIALALLGANAAAKDKPKPAGAEAVDSKAMMEAFQRMGEVRAEHRQLGYFVGDWTTTTQMWMDPAAPPQTSTGKSHHESLYGGRYVQMHFEGQMMGQPLSGQGVIGYDNLRGGYFNTWIDSASTGFWLAHGTWNADTKTYSFLGAMDDPMKPGSKIRVHELIKIVDETHYTFEWYEVRGLKEVKTMQIDYTKL
ncbi:MAG: DUF1579 domain-containing protein [Dokdonella sp.]